MGAISNSTKPAINDSINYILGYVIIKSYAYFHPKIPKQKSS